MDTAEVLIVVAYTYLQNGETLIEQQHYAQDEIEARVESLFTLWDQLTEATKAKGRGLAEALSLMSFNRQVDTVHSMITERVSAVLYLIQ